MAISYICFFVESFNVSLYNVCWSETFSKYQKKKPKTSGFLGLSYTKNFCFIDLYWISFVIYNEKAIYMFYVSLGKGSFVNVARITPIIKHNKNCWKGCWDVIGMKWEVSTGHISYNHRHISWHNHERSMDENCEFIMMFIRKLPRAFVIWIC